MNRMAVLAASVLIVCFAAEGQSPIRVALSGAVQDRAGAAIVGARVELGTASNTEVQSTTTVLERFPRARFVARPDVIKVMRQHASPESLATFWNPRFPGQICERLGLADSSRLIYLELPGENGVCRRVAPTLCPFIPNLQPSLS
jgi:hypothetical protein